MVYGFIGKVKNEFILDEEEQGNDEDLVSCSKCEWCTDSDCSNSASEWNGECMYGLAVICELFKEKE